MKLKFGKATSVNNDGNNNQLETFVYSIIDSIPTAFLVIEGDDKVLLYNNTFVQLWQIPQRVVETGDIAVFFDFLDSKIEQNHFFEKTHDYLNKNKFEAIFEEVSHKNGSVIECYTIPRWINNHINGRVWSFRDISQQKRAEQLLISQKQELTKAHHIALLGSWTYNLLSKEFTHSDSLSRLCEGLLVHKTIDGLLSVIHPDDAHLVRNFFNVGKTEKIPGSLELKYKVVNKKGDIYYLKTSAELLKDRDNNPIIWGITQDVTHQTRLEQGLASAKEAAEDYIRAKDNIFSNISHEMRTPLNAIIGYASIMLQNADNEIQKDYIRSIKTSGESLLSLIEDILYISNVDTKASDIKKEKVNLRKLVSEVHQMFDQKFKRKGIEFTIGISKEIPDYVIIDTARIRQILISLISNGLKFTEKGRVSVKFEGKKSIYKEIFELVIYVEDTGIGIEEKDQNRIFDSFLQIESTSKRSYEGAGLGLYVTKRNVDLLGGTIKVHSVLNKGTVFIINFKNLKIPVDEHRFLLKEHSELNIPRFKKASILVADDHEFNREILRHILNKFDFEILEAENGKDAILLAQKFVPSLIIMDLKMPEITGYNAMKTLRGKPATRDIPIIAFSSYENDVNRENLLNFGFNDFLSKPVTFSKTIKTLRRFLDYTYQEPEEQTSFLKDAKEFMKDEKNNDLLISQLKPLWKHLAEKKTIKEQLDFANKLVAFGQENEIDFIKNHGNLLIESLKVYDIEKSREILDEIELLITGFPKSTDLNLNA